tara:strand:+ start:2222 stop:4624 length:2403 start_codon:yes stop_codon:yes gene_type:complete
MHPLNRKMFQQPIKAQSGVYVPTIEQIMNFYQGGFDQAGQPIDTESFLRAIEATKLMNKEGFFPGEDGGDPLKFMFSPDNKEGILGIADQTGFSGVQSMGFTGDDVPEGNAYQSIIDQGTQEQIAGIMAAAASDPSQRPQPMIDSLLREGAEDGIAAVEGAPETVTTEEGTVEKTELPIIDVTDKLDKTDSFDPKLEEDSPKNISEVMENQSNKIIDTFDALNSEAGGEAFTEGFKTQSQLLLNKALVDLNKAKTIGVEATKEAVEFTRGVIANMAPSEESVNDFYDAFSTLTGVDIRPGATPFKIDSLADTGFAQASKEGKLGEFIVDSTIDAIDKDEEGNIRNPLAQWQKMINDVNTKTKAAGDEIENIKRILGSNYQSLSETDQKLYDKYSQNPTMSNFLVGTKDALDNSINFVKDSVNNVKNTTLTEKQKVISDADNIKTEMDTILQRYQNNEISKEEFETLMNEKNDQLRILGEEVNSKVEEEQKEIVASEDKDNVTGTISTGDAEASDAAAVAEATGGAGATLDGAGKAVVSESISSGFSEIIGNALKESGYNLGAVQNPDSDALKMIYYGLQLAQTPGKPLDAAIQTAGQYVKNEINERYKTKAAQQKLRGEIFKVLLSGKMDLLKEEIKAGNKITKKTKYDIGDKDLLNGTILSTLSTNFNRSIDPNNLTTENLDSLDARYITAVRNKMQSLANGYYNAGDTVPDGDMLALEAINEVDKTLVPELQDITKFFGFKDTGKDRITGFKGATLPITDAIVSAAMNKFNLSKEAAVARIKAELEKKGIKADFSGIL